MRIHSDAEQQSADHMRVWWIAGAACGWAVIFAGLSFFWAAGGKTGLQPLEQASDATSWQWVVANVVAGVGKLLMGVGALVVASGWQRCTPLKPLRILVWVVGVGMLLYGGIGIISDILHVTGVITSDPAARRWFLIYLVLWDPWWTLGGVLFTALAWWTRRASANR